ncbi:MAG: hypothetical protein ACI8PT_000261, partial [Gammaproteobacteria bacterium]
AFIVRLSPPWIGRSTAFVGNVPAIEPPYLEADTRCPVDVVSEGVISV